MYKRQAQHLPGGVPHAVDFEGAVRNGDITPQEAHVGQSVRKLGALVDPAPLLGERLLDLVASPRGTARRADVVAVGEPQGAEQLVVRLVPRVLDLGAELPDVALIGGGLREHGGGG